MLHELQRLQIKSPESLITVFTPQVPFPPFCPVLSVLVSVLGRKHGSKQAESVEVAESYVQIHRHGHRHWPWPGLWKLSHHSRRAKHSHTWACKSHSYSKPDTENSSVSFKSFFKSSSQNCSGYFNLTAYFPSFSSHLFFHSNCLYICSYLCIKSVSNPQWKLHKS